MYRRRLGLLMIQGVLVLTLGACAQIELFTHATKEISRTTSPSDIMGTYKVGNPYEIAGVWYTPAAFGSGMVSEAARGGIWPSRESVGSRRRRTLYLPVSSGLRDVGARPKSRWTSTPRRIGVPGQHPSRRSGV